MKKIMLLFALSNYFKSCYISIFRWLGWINPWSWKRCNKFIQWCSSMGELSVNVKCLCGWKASHWIFAAKSRQKITTSKIRLVLWLTIANISKLFAGNQVDHQNFVPLNRNEAKIDSTLFKSVTIYVISRMGQNFDDYPDFQKKNQKWWLLLATV